MYKLFVNGIQIGSYKSVKNLTSVAFNMKVIENGVKSTKWNGNEFYIRTND